MKRKALISLLLSLAFVVQPLAAAAMETDQYNLPSVPLTDIGDEVSAYIEANLFAAVAKVNADISFHQGCVEARAKTSGCDSSENENKLLAKLRSSDAVAKELYKHLGDGNIFVSHIGQWMNSHEFSSSPSRYKTDFLHSIYVAAPIDYATLSPTVRLHGVEFGTDKLDHLFQQGYRYYRMRNDSIAKGKTADEAARKAIKWGQMTERTYFGILVSGVYSNADLYANYAGMKFYQGLTEPISVGDQTRPALLDLKDGKWTVDAANLQEILLKPFITDHLSEALNPSGYAFTIFGSVRRAVKKNGCPEWRKLLPDATRADLESRSASLELWNGEDYGFTHREKTVPLSVCFDDQPRNNSSTNASAS